MSGPELDTSTARERPWASRPAGSAGPPSWPPEPGATGPWPRARALVWQGKVFDPAEPLAVNRFFGLPMIRAQVYQDRSWLDGAPALVLDYSRTSRVYAQYRDEIRQVAPGLFLGLMYARTAPADPPDVLRARGAALRSRSLDSIGDGQIQRPCPST